ncbi:hypothetical protein [Streptomyces sp. NBC_01264]|uniref:hypothetical protein n=1 Tax=Streptomyces sp. NBC_01264 TaxID=2903804 RepID=UPI00225507FD|nr:hypothetical protein [Streptomyces sp. NBC_01264]MCX4779825.1 hypothetical protein [Streptomyces sp. NBC_01264]
MSGWVFLVGVVALVVFCVALGIYAHASPLLKRGIRHSAVCVNVGQIAGGSMILLEYTPVGAPARQYTVGPFVFPPVQVGGRMDVIYDPKRPQEVTLPDRLPRSTRGLVVTAAVSGAVLAACVLRIVLALRG